MKVTLLQIDITWGDPEINIERVNKLISAAPYSDLYVLPEMWSTGFTTKQTNEIAELESESVSLNWMRNFAKRFNCAISGSIAIKLFEDGDFRNRHYFIDGRNAMEKYYDKHHLFKYGGENIFFKEGTKHTIVNYCGFRFLLLTCYDLRFPNWSRFSLQNQFDAIIVVANWPESRQNAWQILTRARAIENQAFVICCNRVGNDFNSHYLGNSAIISPIGKSLVHCRSNIEDSVTYDIDINQVCNLRHKFNVLDERDIQ